MTVEWSPSSDISKTDKQYVIRAQLPGVRKDDIKVHLQEGMLTISD